MRTDQAIGFDVMLNYLMFFEMGKLIFVGTPAETKKMLFGGRDKSILFPTRGHFSVIGGCPG